ncbi:Spy/CpxP family protein refolding chaperone [Azoarcus sp. L1K30]|uniref:Spy/CpxP family protein refolding chaperone n=1 Tax=Azoarcus sp. L1K30 TaxID=2820277 RepID=UPI001B845225|nr:Spy/CpxP family protein refolding chaperone [Azoarcus sp. L1K30]MBR0568670.1 Spy/CpxP family protein refolding chaperone [Azoarcus sp. L1K30]
MKTWIKTTIAVALIATSAVGATAMARGGECDGMRGGQSAWQEMSPEKMKARMTERVELQAARLELALALTPEQKPAWQAFKTALKDRSEHMASQMEARANAARPKTVLERMDRMAEMSALRQTEMADMRKAVESFYGTLSAAQKTVFDAEFDRMGRRHGADGYGMGGHMRDGGPSGARRG